MRGDVHGWVRELVEPVTHREPFTVTRAQRDGSTYQLTTMHVTEHASLLDQLAAAVEALGSDADGPRPAYASKPAARVDAIDALRRIDEAAARWLRALGEDDPPDTAACVRRLGALLVDADEETASAVSSDVRRWYVTARVLTGWDSPAWAPASTCPVCGRRGTVRIRLASRCAVCVECGSTWDETSIGVLAEHIRAESEAA